MLKIHGPEKAPTVVLLHGGPSVYGYMQTLGKQLDGVRVLDYAQAGAVENPSPDRVVDLDAHVADLHAIIRKHCGDGPPFLLGHSWGADLALIYAASHPEAVRHVIALGTAPLSQQPEDILAASMAHRLGEETMAKLDILDQQLRNALVQLDNDPSHTEALNRLAEQRLKLVDPAYHWDPATSSRIPNCSFDFPSFLSSKASLWKRIQAGEIPSLLRQIQAPVSALHGAEDVIPCEATLEFLQLHIPRLQVHRFQKAGHFLWLEPHARRGVLAQLQAVLQGAGA